VAVISIPKGLRERLGDDGVDALVEVLSQVEASARDASILVVEERFERRVSEEGAKINMRITEEVTKIDNRITEEVAKVNNRMTEEVAKINNRITEEVTKLRAELRAEISKLDNRITEEVTKINNRITEEVAKLRVEVSRVQSNLIKWMFIFWLGQVGAMIGILFAFFRH
jgi:uncharacterized phage infection (PIP) family protein YhgE